MQRGYLVGQTGDRAQIKPLCRCQHRTADLDQHAPGLGQNLPALLPPIGHFWVPASREDVSVKNAKEQNDQSHGKTSNRTHRSRNTLKCWCPGPESNRHAHF